MAWNLTFQPRAGRVIPAANNMTKITTQFTEAELIDLGRAMEQAGVSNFEDFIKDAVLKHKRTILEVEK